MAASTWGWRVTPGDGRSHLGMEETTWGWPSRNSGRPPELGDGRPQVGDGRPHLGMAAKTWGWKIIFCPCGPFLPSLRLLPSLRRKALALKVRFLRVYYIYPGFEKQMYPGSLAAYLARQFQRSLTHAAPARISRRPCACALPSLSAGSSAETPRGSVASNLLPSTARFMMVGWVFLVLIGACQFGHGVGGFTTNFIRPFVARWRGCGAHGLQFASLGSLARI